MAVMLLWSFVEVALWHGYSPVNLLHTFRTLLLRTSLEGWFWRLSMYYQNLLKVS